MLFREALRTGFFELQLARDKYRELCGSKGMQKHLVRSSKASFWLKLDRSTQI